ncbi:MAG TPA: hemolysin family protein [Vicinamibacterales bacterium]
MVVATLVAAVLILATALYVAAEFAAVGVRRSRLRALAEEGNRFAQWLLPIVEVPAELDRYIAVSQIGITLTSLILGAYAQATFAVSLTPLVAELSGLQAGAAQSLAAGFVLATLTILQVLIGELVPKTLALQYPTPSALYTVVPMAVSAWVFKPFNAFLNGSGLLILRLLGAPHQSHRHIHSPEEISLLIAESRDGGLLEPDEHLRLQRALRLNLRQARQLMVPRRKIEAIGINTPLHEVIGILVQSPYSRLPVYRDSIDNIVGTLHTKDVVRWLVSAEPDGARASVDALMRPITSVHESVTADRVLRQLRERRAHQALVVDEFGGTAGILSLEDVLTELIGDVGDEFKEGEAVPETLADGRIRLPGDMAVQDAAALLGSEWETDASTVGGLVTEALGHLPAAGEHVTIGDYEFEIERVVDRAVGAVVVKRLVPAASEERE